MIALIVGAVVLVTLIGLGALDEWQQYRWSGGQPAWPLRQRRHHG